ncbi:class F sortase [Streptomyces sp. NPDC058572]|uniref:class F sortase n=1 Tax=Streptomyces sp. NPDC058572 TaxID=3346546 RepID=UPI00364AF6D5
MGPTRPRSVLRATTLVVMLIAGIWILHHGLSGETAPQPSAAQAHSTPAAPPPDPVRPAGELPRPAQTTVPRPAQTTAPRPRPAVRPAPQPVSDPARLRIRAIGVNASMVKLALNSSGALEPPPAAKAGVAGWYSKGPVPGESGTAVVTGHVDSPTGRAVFFLLGVLPKRSTIEITRRDGHTSVFSVDAVEMYQKNKFPDQKVYGSSVKPQLRIITCGGGYTKATGYRGNVVVYASLVRTTPAPPRGTPPRLPKAG